MLRTIIQNSGSNILVLVIRVLITLVMTPVILRSMGNHVFGIWEMVSAVIGYMGLLDLGMKPAITRYAAKYRGEGNREKLFELFSTSLIFMGGVGLILCVTFSIWATFGADTLSQEGNSNGYYATFLLIIAFQLLIVFPGYVAECFIFGFQKYALNNLIIVINIVVGAMFIYFLINESNALILVALVGTIGMIARYFLLFLIVAKQNSIEIHFRVSNANMKMFYSLTKFGSKSFMQGVGNVVENGSGLLLVGWLLGPSLIPYYAIPANLARYLQTIGWAITQIFMPLFTDLIASDKNAKLIEIYLNSSRYIIGLLVPLGVCMCLFGVDFIGLWVGPEYIKGYEPLLYLLVIYYLLPFMSPFNGAYLVAKDKHRILAIVYPAIAVVNVGACFFLINLYGVIGAVLGAIIPASIAVPFLLKYVCKELGIGVKIYIVTCIIPTILPTLILITCIELLQHFSITGYLDLVVQGLASVFVYFIAFVFLVLKSGERNLLFNYILKLFER